ncbi:MAG TPA: hypothetical protein VHB97_24520 [Polyangia bacterium]|nr:hypothetical protein [Polyangia bacterium]
MRGVIDSAFGELWREGEFRLEPVWKILVTQPGLSAEEVAPPLLVFKAYEKELGVPVRIPQALSAIPRGEQVKLREQLGIQRADFQRAIDEMTALVAEQKREVEHEQMLREAEVAAQGPEAAVPTSRVQKAKPAAGNRMGLAAALAVVGVIAAGVSIWWSARDTATTFDLSDVAGSLALANGKTGGGSLTATIVDPRWDSMSQDERKRTVGSVFDIEYTKGIRAITLLDAAGNSRALAGEGPDGRFVMIQ